MKQELLEDLVNIHYREFQNISISPQNEDLLVVLGNTDVPYANYSIDICNRSIWKVNVRKKVKEVLCTSEEDAHSPAYSPCGSKIAYLSRKSGLTRIWMMNHKGEEKRLISQEDYPGKDPYRHLSFVWSEEGDRLAYVTLPNGSLPVIIDEQEKECKKKTEIKAVKNPKATWNELYQNSLTLYKSEIWVHRIKGNKQQKVAKFTGEEINVLGWRSHRLIVQVGIQLREYDLDGEFTVIGNEPLDFIKVSNENIYLLSIHNNLLEIGKLINGGIRREQTYPFKYREARFHDLSSDLAHAVFTYQEGVTNHLALIDISTGEISTITNQYTVVNDHSHVAKPTFFDDDGSLVFPHGSVHSPSEIFAYNINEQRTERITDFNDKEIMRNQIPVVKVVNYKSNGFLIESLLILPTNYEQGKQYPTLVYLHGGPESLNLASFSYINSSRGQSAAYYLASHGYAILMPNFRGSSGYGDKFKNELGDYNMVKHPYEDVMAGISFLIDNGIADRDQLGIYGSSFGALVTAWATSQTNLFKAAVGMLGLQYDMLYEDRKYGKPFYAFYKNRLGVADPLALWLNPEIYNSMSPINLVSHMKTPFLFVDSGEGGANSLTENFSRPLMNGLLAMGIDTGQIFYPTACHTGGWNDSYKKDYMKRLVAWFDHYIKGEEFPDWFWK